MAIGIRSIDCCLFFASRKQVAVASGQGSTNQRKASAVAATRRYSRKGFVALNLKLTPRYLREVLFHCGSLRMHKLFSVTLLLVGCVVGCAGNGGDGGSIAPATAPLITKGNLSVCNFRNDSTPGVTYDPFNDTLYVVDTSSTSVIAIVGISTTPAPVPTFSGPSITAARVIAHAPFYAVERCSAQERRFGGRKRRYRHPSELSAARSPPTPPTPHMSRQ
jgi:hypothetical protein